MMLALYTRYKNSLARSQRIYIATGQEASRFIALKVCRKRSAGGLGGDKQTGESEGVSRPKATSGGEQSDNFRQMRGNLF